MKDNKLIDYRTVPDIVMDYIRKIAVDAIDNRSFSVQEAVEFLGISKSTIYEWLKKFDQSGYDALNTVKAPGADPIMTSEMDEWLKGVVLGKTPMDFGFESTLWTCKIMMELLHEEFGIEVSESTISIHLKKMRVSYQRPRYRAAEQDPKEVEKFLNDKFPRIQKLAKKLDADIAFEDESGVGLSDHAGMTWGEVNHTPDVIMPQTRGGYNLLSIVTAQGELHYSIRSESTNSDGFISFLRQILQGRQKPLILLMDRASFHRSKKVRNYVRAHRKQIRVYFFPSYSPELNPDELVWNEVKNNNIRKTYIATKSQLQKKLRSVLKRLQLDIVKVKSFFKLDDTKYAGETCPVINS